MKKKKEICDAFIEAWKPLFEAYPDLKSVPVYSWGRFYKYECAGSPFEQSIEDGISHFKHDRVGNFQWELIKEIDDTHNKQGGKLWVGEWGDYLPDRGDMVKAFDFDDRGGMCIVISRNEDSFSVDAVECDSPE